MSAEEDPDPDTEEEDIVYKPNLRFHNVTQRSSAWRKLRARRIGGSEVGKAIGIDRFESPRKFYESKVPPPPSPSKDSCKDLLPSSPLGSRGSAARDNMAHGTHFESRSETHFKEWLHAYCEVHQRQWHRQYYQSVAGYYTPTSGSTHRYFTRKEDATSFGVSLDVEGSSIDCEIKNPVSLSSFSRYYRDRFSESHFVQVQWTMAMRERRLMFFVVTQYDACSEALRAMVVWLVEFDDEYFLEFVLKRARLMSDYVQGREDAVALETTIPWLNKPKEEDLAHSTYYDELFKRRCHRLHVYPLLASS